MPEVEKIVSRLPLEPETVPDLGEVYRRINQSADPVAAGKQTLVLSRNRGAFLKNCPGTRHYTCCDYLILHVGSFCTMDCAYCILQTYFHPPVLQYFVNHTDLFRELEDAFASGRRMRIGTGEFTDSLIWQAPFDLSAKLVAAFAGQSRAVLELKTKTTAIEPLLHLDHRRRTIAAWSVNTPEIIRTQERRTASLKARLTAAAACAEAGYPLAFHFDPMVIYDGCEDDYLKVVDEIYAAVPADSIVWISMGTLRFMPELKGVIERRFPGSTMVYGEFISGLDGKMRYFKPLRIRLFKTVADRIRSISPATTVYLCMEDDEVWQKAFGFIPSDFGGLPRMLDRSAEKHCGLK